MDSVLQVILPVSYALLMITVVMTIAGYSVLAERKVSSLIQGRVGPNRTTIPLLGSIPLLGRFLTRLGIFQLPADGLKFLFKEEPLPGHVKKGYFTAAPVIALIPALTTMVVLPFGQYVDGDGTAHVLGLAPGLDIGILFILAISSLSVYGIVIAGWASNSKYPFLGAIRSSAQMISYELAMGLSIVPVFLWAAAPGAASGLNLGQVVASQQGLWLVIWQPVSALVFMVALFAETNRLPFDMAESETDLVGGFHTEYGAFKFGLFFTGEYAHIVMGSALFTVLFLGGWNFLPFVDFPWPAGIAGALLSTGWFLLKIFALIFLFIWVRWTLPRFRYDQVMRLGWKVLLPVAIANLVFNAFLIAGIDLFLYNR